MLQLYLEAQAKKFGANVLTCAGTIGNKALQIFVGDFFVFWVFFVRWGAKQLKNCSIQVNWK